MGAYSKVLVPVYLVVSCLFICASNCSVILSEKPPSDNAGFWKGDDGRELPCSVAQAAYHTEVCRCEARRNAVIACIPGANIGDCWNYDDAIKECQLRGSANLSSPRVMSHGGENGTTPSVVSTSMQPDESAPLLSSSVGVTPETHAAGAPTDSSASTPSVMSTSSVRSGEITTSPSSDADIALVTRAAVSPSESSQYAISTAYIVAVTTVAVLYVLAWLCAAAWICCKLRNTARLDYSAVRTA